MKIQTIVFDVDDTLYDQQEPFQEAVNKIAPHINGQITPLDLYRRFRFYSDEVFTQYTSGNWTLEYMRYERFARTFAPFIAVDETISQNFQHDYELALSNIHVQDDIKRTLDWLKEYPVQLGIITNGPDFHQQKKVEQLQLTRWFPEQNIFISGALESEKPQKEIFDHVAAQMDAGSPETILYIGDSFENDIVGSHLAGWKNIWLNHRHRSKPEDCSKIEPTNTATSFDQLQSLIKEMIKS